MTEKNICKSVLDLVISILECNEYSRGCCGSGIVNDFTVEYNFDFKLIDNETGEEI